MCENKQFSNIVFHIQHHEWVIEIRNYSSPSPPLHNETLKTTKHGHVCPYIQARTVVTAVTGSGQQYNLTQLYNTFSAGTAAYNCSLCRHY